MAGEPYAVILMAYDLLEQGGIDLRPLPLAERRVRLEQVVQDAGTDRLLLSPTIAVGTWEELEQAWRTSRGRSS